LSNAFYLTGEKLGKKWHCQERKIFIRMKYSFTGENTCPWERNEGVWGRDAMPPVILNLAPTPLYASGKSLWYQMDNKPSGT
jgi:hypothetical protein